MKKDDRVEILDTFPESKLQILGLKVGDLGTVLWVSYISTSGVALVSWDRGTRTNANCDDIRQVES